MARLPEAALREYVERAAPPSRFLAQGFVTMTITYRSRDLDPQNRQPIDDTRAALEFIRRLTYVDDESVGLFGCSGGADLALEVASATHVSAVVAEEPATMMFTGVFNTTSPKAGARYTPPDSAPITENPSKYLTEEYKQRTRSKLEKIHAPLLLLQGDEASPLNRWNATVILPELRRMNKSVAVVSSVGEPHCFAWDGRLPFGPAGRWRHSAKAAEAFSVANEFLRKHVRVQPQAIDARLVTYVALED